MDIKNLRILRHIQFIYKGIIKRKTMYRKASLAYDDCDEVIQAGFDKQEILNDMMRMYMRYGYSFSEYLGFQFYKRAKSDRLTFIADWEHFGYADAMNNYANRQIFDNKYQTYQKFKPFFHREMILCKTKSDSQEYNDFRLRHSKCVVKPIKAAMGEGFQILEPGKHSFNELLENYPDGFILEEYIVQDSRLAKFHAQSVNTIRIPTIRFDDEIVLLHPRLRIGQHGSHIDNAGGGGILCDIDLNTGKIISAADKKGNRYETHPDTKERIIGFQIPLWEEAKRFARELSGVVSDNHYTAWDIALSENEWIMVEGNRRGQFGWQFSLQKGAREEMDNYLARLGKRY